MYTTLVLMHVEGELLTEAEMSRAFISPTVVNKKENNYMQGACANVIAP